MHYLIDGYNLLFRLSLPGDSFKVHRELIISRISQMTSAMGLLVTMIFDATHTEGSGSKSHFQDLEIIFTKQGQSADQWIIDELKQVKQPRGYIVITCDKLLAKEVQNLGVASLGVDEFLNWLKQRYNNFVHGKKKKKNEWAPPSSPPSPVIAPAASKKAQLPNEGSLDYYLQVFEKRFEELPPLPSSAKIKKRKKADKIKVPEQKVSEVDRWLELFEKRLKDIDFH